MKMTVVDNLEEHVARAVEVMLAEGTVEAMLNWTFEVCDSREMR